MRGWRGGLVLVAVLVLLGAFVGSGSASAGEQFTLRIATLAPRGSSWMKVFKAWNASLKRETGGKLQLRFYPGGVSGDERDFIRKMRAGQLDGASVTATGLGQVVRPVLVLQLPRLLDDYEKLDRARRALDDEFHRQFRDAGFELLGWGDVGRARIFSTHRIVRPSDLKRTRPWAWREDAIFSTFLKVVGANPVRLGVPEVYPALQTEMVDTVPSSALAAVSLQWYTKLKYVTKQSSSVLIGATILRKEAVDALPEPLREALRRTAAKAHALLNKQVRRDDERAYRTLLQRGLQEVDISAHRAEWEEAARKVRERLAGRLYPQALLKRVEQAAR